jgi:hypothetical protein
VADKLYKFVGKALVLAGDRRSANDIALDELNQEKLEEFKSSRQIRPLSVAEKKEIFKSLRYQFMTHEQLLHLLGNPHFADGYEFVREGISYKLLAYENKLDGHKFSLDLAPRPFYFLPDIALADVDHETGDGKLDNKLGQQLRKKLKEAALGNLTDE